MRILMAMMGAAVLTLTLQGSDARADYQTDKDNRNIAVVERAVAKFQKNPALFNGTTIVPGASAVAANNHTRQCNDVIRTFNKYFARVSKRGMKTPRARAVYQKVKALNGWCKALTAANAIYLRNAQAAEAAATAKRAARKGTCDSMRRDAIREVKRLHEVMDTWSGGRTPGTAEHVKEFRGHLDKLVAVCSKPEYKDVVASCKGYGIISSSATNKRYDYGDICAPAADAKKTLTDVVMRMIQSTQRHAKREPMTLKSFKFKDGWLHQTGPVEYKTHFQVTQKKKDALKADITAAFAAAGVDAPADLSMLWANQQAYLDSLKTVVDATAGDWKITEGSCKGGYTCRMAKKWVKKNHRRARIKAVHGKKWVLVKNSLGIPLRRYYGMFVVYKLPGEPYCQVRSLTAYEKYRGGGKFKRPSGLSAGYVRFQKSCR